jgi:hypothetical protein
LVATPRSQRDERRELRPTAPGDDLVLGDLAELLEHQ